MKKIFAILLASFLTVQSYAQLIQASVAASPIPNHIKILLKSDLALDGSIASTVSTLQFNVGIADIGLPSPPSIKVLPTVGAFPLSALWSVDPPYQEGGYWNYNIFLISYPRPTAAANTPFEVMEVEFDNFPLLTATVGLVSLPEGGSTTSNAYFVYNSIPVKSNGMSLLYYTPPPPLVTTDNQNTYLDGVTLQTGTSTSLLNNIVLPVKFAGFSAVKKDNGANLNWQVENETALTDRYEVERSLNGIDFKSITTIAPKNNGRSANAYIFTDADILSIHTSAVVYYRIKQTDKDGQFIYTEIKSVRLDSKGFSASIFPNPVRSKANLSIDLTENSPVTITLNDANGKVLKNIQVQGLKGINKKEVDMSNLSSGNYLLRIQTPTETTTLNVVKGN